MSAAARPPRRQAGFSLIEVLVSLVIMMLGVLGLVGMMVTGQKAEAESYQRAQALLLLQDMVGRINANRNVAGCYILSEPDTGNPTYLGVGSSFTPNCSLGRVEAYTRANRDMNEWHALLTGASEQLNSNNTGGIVGARGCISGNPVTGVYLVSVAWQGLVSTGAPSDGLPCGKGLYGSESLRRVVSLPVQIANLY